VQLSVRIDRVGSPPCETDRERAGLLPPALPIVTYGFACCASSTATFCATMECTAFVG
jgi:hypothetical protein